MDNVVVSTLNLSRKEWLEIRRRGIGGSDAGVILGVNQYKTVHELYLEKRGEIEPPDLSDNEAVHFGNILEDVVAEEYARRTGTKVRRVNQVLHHPTITILQANIDRMLVGQKKGLECKTTGVFTDGWGKPGTDEVPESYLAQCMHYMIVTGCREWDLAVLIGGQKFSIYTINYDVDLAKNMIDMSIEFWDSVKTGVAPPIEYAHRSTNDLIRRMYPGTNGQSVELPQEAFDWHAKLVAAKTVKKQADAEAEEAKNALLAMIGENAIGILPQNAGNYTRKHLIRITPPCDKEKKVPYLDFRFKK